MELFTRLKRVRYEWQVDPRPPLAEVADQLCAVPDGGAVVVANTIEHARTVFALLAERSEAPVPRCQRSHSFGRRDGSGHLLGVRSACSV